MARTRLKLLGSVGLSVDGVERTTVTAQTKRLAILTYLALADAPGRVRRDTLLALFWPEHDQTRARRALRQALYFLRRELPERAIEATREEVRLRPGALAVDVVEVLEAIDRDDVARVVELWSGPLLDGFFVSGAPEFERWLDATQAGVRERVWIALHRAGTRADRNGCLEEAVRYASIASTLRPLHEPTARNLMELLGRTGQRSAALHVFERLRIDLGEAYGTTPEPETVRMMLELRDGGAGPSEDPSSASSRVELLRDDEVRLTPDSASTSEDDPLVSRPTNRWHALRSPHRHPWVIAAVGVTLLLLGLRPWSSAPAQGGIDPNDIPSVAVLPPMTLTEGTVHEELIAGLHGQLIHVLDRATGGGLKVIARQAVFGYAPSADPARVASDLNVDYLITGTIEAHPDTARVDDLRFFVELLRPDDRTILWSGTYEGNMSPGSVLDVHAAMVKEIARSLVVTIQDDDVRRAAAAGTDDAEAFSLYLRSLTVDSPTARDLLVEAVERDPEFLLAHARLGRVYGTVWQDYERTTANAEAAIRHARVALDLEPSSPDAILGMAWASYRVGNLQDAQSWLAQVGGSLRGEYQSLELAAYLNRRIGRAADALEPMERMIELSPTTRGLLDQHASTFVLLRRYDEAIPLLESGGTRPERLLRVRWYRSGDLRELERGVGPYTDLPRWEAAMMRGDWTRAEEVVGLLPEIVPTRQELWLPSALLAAWVQEASGNSSGAAAAFAEARAIAAEHLAREPSDARLESALALAVAGLGDLTLAVEHAEAAVRARPVHVDMVQGPPLLFHLAAVYARVGRTEDAIAALETLLSVPTLYNAIRVQHDYLMQPLVDDPRFIALMERERARVF